MMAVIFPTSARTFFNLKIKQLENKLKSQYQIIQYSPDNIVNMILKYKNKLAPLS